MHVYRNKLGLVIGEAGRAGFVAAMAAMSYEEARKERLEENKRRMEELGLVSLAKELKKPKIPKKPAVAKPKMELQEARRSSRVAAKPVVIYREQSRKVPGGAKSTLEGRERRERLALRRRYLTEAARKAAIDSAEELLKSIENPAFVKPMQHSRISTVFWLALPADFCKEHMPLTDEKVTLEDEKEKECECLYIATKTGMSSGWRGFAIDHDLMDGDCCIFELVSPLRFKVHIVRFVDDEEEDDDEDEDEEYEDESDDSDDEGDRKKARAKKPRRSFSSAKKKKTEDDDDEDDEDEVDEDEEDDEEEEFDSDVCDDHVSDEEPDEEDDSEDDYSPRLSEKEVDTLVAAPSRASRGLKRKLVKEDDDDTELGHEENSNESQEEEM